MKCPMCNLTAVCYNDLSSHTPVINKSTIDHFMWIYIPCDVVVDHQLFAIDSILPNKEPIDFLDRVYQECRRPWLRVESALLDLSPGKHIYKISFVNWYTHDVQSLYVSYVIQDDDPDKPYIYMKRESRKECDKDAHPE